MVTPSSQLASTECVCPHSLEMVNPLIQKYILKDIKKAVDIVREMVYNVCEVIFMRVNMTLNDELLKRIDTYAKDNYMNRSSVVSFACNQFLTSVELSSLLVDMKRAIKKIADSGTCTAEQLKEFEKYEALCDIVVSRGLTDEK